MRTGYGWTLRCQVQVLCICKDALATRGISNTHKLCDDHVGGSYSGVEENGGECDLEADTSFAKFMLLTKPLKHSLMYTALAGIETF